MKELQTEIFTWYPYPDWKPTFTAEYWCKTENKLNILKFDVLSQKWYIDEIAVKDDDILAWAFFSPYQTDKSLNYKIEIEKSLLLKLVYNFYEMCSLCDELDIYEHNVLDTLMQKNKKWVDDNFGRDLEIFLNKK